MPCYHEPSFIFVIFTWYVFVLTLQTSWKISFDILFCFQPKVLFHFFLTQEVFLFKLFKNSTFIYGNNRYGLFSFPHVILSVFNISFIFCHFDTRFMFALLLFTLFLVIFSFIILGCLLYFQIIFQASISWFVSFCKCLLRSQNKRRWMRLLGFCFVSFCTGDAQKWIVLGGTRADKARDFIGKGCPGGGQEGKGTQEHRSATWLRVSGFMVRG